MIAVRGILVAMPSGKKNLMKIHNGCGKRIDTCFAVTENFNGRVFVDVILISLDLGIFRVGQGWQWTTDEVLHIARYLKPRNLILLT